ncbi:MAG: 50S ribosomal protein L29 [Promethearchaeota archaeon]
MGKLKAKDIRKMGPLEREKKILELREELLLLRSKSAMGGALEDPSRIREIRRTIARIKTIIREEQLGLNKIYLNK